MQIPESLEHAFVGRTSDVQAGVIIERLFAASHSYFFELNETPESLSDFDVYQVRGVQAFLGHQRPGFDFLAFLSSKHELESGRCVYDYQRASRSARTSSEGEVLPR